MTSHLQSHASLARERVVSWAFSSPEEVVDHVEDFTAPHVDEQRIVVITDPARARRSRRKAVHPRIVDPIAAAVIVGPQAPADREGLVSPTERIVVGVLVVHRPIASAPIVPIVALIVPPVRGPLRPRRGAPLGAERRLGPETRS